MTKALSVAQAIALIGALSLTTIYVYSCDNDDSISNCSARGKPQYRDPRTGRSTCRDR